MFSVLDRYLLREVTLNWLAVTLVLWAIVVSNRLARFLGEAASGELPGNVIFVLIALKSVSYLVALLPVALYLGALLALGRLYRDSEMAAMAACGVGPGQLYRPLLSLAALVAVLCTWLSLDLAPRAAAVAHEIRAQAEQRQDLSVISAGRFQEARDGGMIVYTERLSNDGALLHELFVHRLERDQTMLITANSAHTEIDNDTGDRFLVMAAGHRYQGLPGEENFRMMTFDRHGLRIDPAEKSAGAGKRDTIPTSVLLQSENPGDIAELQWRLSLPVAALVLMVLAVPLSRTTPRQGRYAKLLAAVLLFIIYYNLLASAQVWVERGQVAPLPGMWWVHGLPLLVAVALFYGWRPRRRRQGSATRAAA